jgi:cytochrome c553
MKRRSLLLTAAIVGITTFFLTTLIYAGTKLEAVIKLADPAYKEHKKGIVEFTHKKHQDDYAKQFPEFYKLGCGECHHDKDNKPLSNLKEGDNVQRCIECHQKPSEKPKGKDAPKLSKKEEMEYHAEALHDNCRGCHRKVNKKTGKKAAPTTCTKCHPKVDK